MVVRSAVFSLITLGIYGTNLVWGFVGASGRAASLKIQSPYAHSMSLMPSQRVKGVTKSVFEATAVGEASVLDKVIRRDMYQPKKIPFGNNPNPDFEPNLGKVIDALRSDYPRIFHEPLDFSIYSPNVELMDPSGVAFRGLPMYKRLFATMRFFRSALMDHAETKFRIVYDWTNQTLRVTWHATLVLKTRRQHPLFVDGVSVYHINDDGFVFRHNLETIIVNGTPVEPPFTNAFINMDPFLAGAHGFFERASADPVAPPTALQAKGGFTIMGCEDSWDCDRPQTCCDFIFAKVCCNSGSPVHAAPQRVLIPIPIDDQPRYPEPYPYPDRW